eukprot:2116087-Prymnesium_polylepis.1
MSSLLSFVNHTPLEPMSGAFDTTQAWVPSVTSGDFGVIGGGGVAFFGAARRRRITRWRGVVAASDFGSGSSLIDEVDN